MVCYSYCKLLVPINSYAQLIISLDTKDKFKNFLANASHVKKVYKVYKWLWKEHEEGVETYNQLLRNKNVVNKDNSRLRQERNEQKKNILKMKGAFTYVEEQVAELQAKQYCKSTLQPSLSNQATLLPATPSEPTLVRENKKIVVVPDSLIFNGDEKEKKVLYDH